MNISPVMELLDIVRDAPNPANYKNDSELAQAYKNWFYGKRTEMPNKKQMKEFVRGRDGELLDATPMK